MREFEKRDKFLTYLNVFFIALSFILVFISKILSFKTLIGNVGNVEGESVLVETAIGNFVVTAIFILVYYVLFVLTTIYSKRKKEIALINLMLSAFSLYSPINTLIYCLFENNFNIESILTLVSFIPVFLLIITSLIIFHDTRKK